MDLYAVDDIQELAADPVTLKAAAIG